jgi:hypothetical protein
MRSQKMRQFKHTDRGVPAFAAAAVLAIAMLAGGPGMLRATAAPVTSKSTMSTVKVKVLSVDQKNRIVQVQGPQGNKWTILVDDAVQHLDKVKPGDSVVIRYMESVALDIHKAGSGKKVGLVHETKVTRAAPGATPAGVKTDRITANLEVLVVNKRDYSVTFKNTQGLTEWIKVKNPKLKPYVKTLKQGDIVSISYEEAVALTLKPAGGAG